MKPVIGLVADVHAGKHIAHSVHQKYLEAVSAGADATILILPALIDAPGAAFTNADDLTAILTLLDGLFLTGATSNVAPARYGATPQHPDSPSDPARDHVTLALVRAAVAAGTPVLGVCRGCQEINVALGGTLHQSVHTVPGLADHREPPGDLAAQYAPSHTVTFTPGGLLATLAATDTVLVNSLHTQGVDRLAPPLTAEATAPDGLIEAFRLSNPNAFLLGVQWHPEWQFRDNPLSVGIFRTFGHAARAYKKAKHGALPQTPSCAARSRVTGP